MISTQGLGPRSKAVLFLLAWAWAAVFVVAIMVQFTGAPVPTPGTAPVVSAPATCEAPEGTLFNPCATLDTTQVQDRRAPSCAWQDGRWVAVPCHYSDATLDLTIESQP